MGIFTRRRSHHAEALADDDAYFKSGLTPEAAAETYGLTLDAAAEFVALADEAHAAYWSGNDEACERASWAATDFAYDPENWRW